MFQAYFADLAAAEAAGLVFKVGGFSGERRIIGKNVGLQDLTPSLRKNSLPPMR